MEKSYTIETILQDNRDAIIKNNFKTTDLVNELRRFYSIDGGIHLINIINNANIFFLFKSIDLTDNLNIQLFDIISEMKVTTPAVRNHELIYIYDLLVNNIFLDLRHHTIDWKKIFNSDIFPFQQGHFWGLKDINNKTVVSARYEEIKDYFNGYATIRSENKYGVVDNTGKVIIDAIYDNKNFLFINGISKYIIKVNEKFRYGLINTKGEIKLETNYSLRNRFDDCFITKNDKSLYGILNLNLRKKIEPKFFKIEPIGKHIINCYTKQTEFSIYNSAFECIASNVEICELYEHEYFKFIDINKKTGLLSKQGKVILEPKYKSIKRIELGDSDFYVLVNSDNESSVYDINKNKKIITYESISIINGVRDCLLVEDKNKFGVYSLFKRNFTIPIEYNLIKEGGKVDHVIVKKGKEYGVIDLNNEIIIALNYNEITIAEKLYLVKKKSLHGVFSLEGEIVLNIKFNEIKPLQTSFQSYNKFIIKIEDKIGLIDDKENEIIPCMYDEIIPNSNKYAVKYKNKFGVLSSKGEIITDLIYESMEIYLGQFILGKNKIFTTINNISDKPIGYDNKSIEQVKREIEKDKKKYKENMNLGKW